MWTNPVANQIWTSSGYRFRIDKNGRLKGKVTLIDLKHDRRYDGMENVMEAKLKAQSILDKEGKW